MSLRSFNIFQPILMRNGSKIEFLRNFKTTCDLNNLPISTQKEASWIRLQHSEVLRNDYFALNGNQSKFWLLQPYEVFWIYFCRQYCKSMFYYIHMQMKKIKEETFVCNAPI